MMMESNVEMISEMMLYRKIKVRNSSLKMMFGEFDYEYNQS